MGLQGWEPTGPTVSASLAPTASIQVREALKTGGLGKRNVVGGGVFVGCLYWLASPVRCARVPEVIRTGTAPVLIGGEQTP